MQDRPWPNQTTVPAPAATGEWELIHDCGVHVHDVDGETYFARVYGQPREDGTWIGWIEFVAVGTDAVLRTERETTQSSRDDLAYWAAGLETVYLEGALQRAREHAASR